MRKGCNLDSRSEPASPLQAPTLRNGLRSPAIANSNSSTTSSPSSSALSNSRGAVNHKPKTQISSVYTQLSSIKHSNHHHHQQQQHHGSSSTMGHKRSSLGSNCNLNQIASSPSSTAAAANGSPMKTVRTTLIGNVLTSSKLNQSNSSVSPPPQPPTNGTKLLKTSIRTQMNGGNGLITTHKQSSTSPSNKRLSAIKPPSSFANSTFPADSPAAHKCKSAPVTPMTERIPALPVAPPSPMATPSVQIVIETIDNNNGTEELKENSYTHEKQNGGSSSELDDDTSDANNNQNNGNDDDDKEQIAEMEKDAINNKINNLKLANGLTGCNDSSCKESSLVI